jgi:protein disulfide-isomerase A1
MVPTVFQFTEDEIEAVFGQQQNVLILFRAETDKDSTFQKTFEEAAVAHKGKILFSYAGTANQIQSKLAEFMGVTEEDFPTLRALLPADMKKFNFDGDVKTVTEAQIGTFIDGIKDGSLKPHLKSAAVPETQGNVVVVVGTEFEKLVLDNTKDVLVKFYAPWCGHCKKLAPIWDELGEHYKDNANVVIAKFDSTVNEADGVEIRGYPTLKWYPRGNKAGESYEGERDLPAFIKFIDENMTKDESAKQEEL